MLISMTQETGCRYRWAMSLTPQIFCKSLTGWRHSSNTLLAMMILPSYQARLSNHRDVVMLAYENHPVCWCPPQEQSFLTGRPAEGQFQYCRDVKHQTLQSQFVQSFLTNIVDSHKFDDSLIVETCWLAVGSSAWHQEAVLCSMLHYKCLKRPNIAAPGHMLCHPPSPHGWKQEQNLYAI